MPWRSAEASKRAVRGCYGAAGKNPKKRKKCRRMAHEARLFRMHNTLKPAEKPHRKRSGK